jgi:hypothetical protein
MHEQRREAGEPYTGPYFMNEGDPAEKKDDV